MASFEDMATELTLTIHALKSKKEKLKGQIEEDEMECEKIDAELEILVDRKKEIENSLKTHRAEREELVSIIDQTEETKQKIIESLRFLGANLKKMKIQQERD